MKLTLQLGILSSVNIILAFFFQWYVLTYFGASRETDALFASMTIPQLVLSVVSGSLVHVLVPLLAGENKTSFRNDAWGFLILIGGLFSFISIFLYISGSWWIPLTVPGFNDTGQALTIELTRIQLICMVFTAINGVQWAAYHAQRKFVWVEFSSILANGVSIFILTLVLPRYGIVAAAWLMVFRMALQTILLFPEMGQPVYPDLDSLALKEAWHRIKPLLAGTAYYRTDPLIDRFLLSLVGTGSLSIYYLGQQIYAAISQVLNKSITVPMVPALSILYKSWNINGFYFLYYRKLKIISGIAFFGLIVHVFWGHFFLSLLIGYGKFTTENIEILWQVLIVLSGAFFGGAAAQITSSVFYSKGDTSTPTKLSIISYTLYIPGKIFAFYFWGMVGLAIATSLYYLINLFTQMYFIELKKSL